MKRIELIFLMALLTVTSCKGNKKEKYVDKLPEKTESGVILHAFGWSYDQIRENLQSISDAGYKAVQTMPVQQPKSGGANWTFFYQPVSFTVGNDSPIGNKESLIKLCAAAEEYGIDIISDIVFNHLATDGGVDGYGLPRVDEEVNNFEPYIYTHQEETFHHLKNPTGSGAVTQIYAYGGLPDLNTGNAYVQERALALLKECIDCGVDGFRFDAAKHIETSKDPDYPSNFWENTLGVAKEYYKEKNNGKELYAYGEILNDVDGGRDISYYTDLMHVTDNSYINNVSKAVLTDKKADGAVNNPYGKNTAAKKLVTWVESHDTYADEGVNHTGNKKLMRMWGIVGSRKDTTNLFFARPKDGVEVIPMGEVGTTDYEDEHFSAVNRFHNRFIGADEEQSSCDSVFYVNERYTDKDQGAIVVDMSLKGSGTISFKHLKDGKYYEQITGQEVVVKGGSGEVKFDDVGVAVLTKTQNKVRPALTINKRSQQYYKSFDVKLSVTNATTASYQLDDGAETKFEESATVRIGEGKNAGDVTTLTVKYGNGEYETKRVYTYEKVYVVEGKFNVLNLKETYLTNYELYIWSWDSTGKYSKDYSWDAEHKILFIDKASTYTGFLLVIFAKDHTPAKMDKWEAPLKQTGDIDPATGFYNAKNF